MVNKIYQIKNQLIEKVEKDINERGLERIDVQNLGEVVDMIKDLAEAEKDCWKADYYRSVTEAMKEGKSGYTTQGGGTGSSAGYGSQGMRSGYQDPNARMGYSSASGHQDVMDMIRRAMAEASPSEKDRLRSEVYTMMGAM